MNCVQATVLAGMLFLVTSVCSTGDSCVQRQFDVENHPELCPPWFFCKNGTVNCNCIDRLPDRGIKCYQQKRKSSLQLGYCLTYDINVSEVHLGECPYELRLKLLQNWHFNLPCNLLNLSEVNSICAPLNRAGKLCANCIPGYGPGVFSFNFHCYKCSGHYHGWGLYLTLEFSLLTLFFCVIVCFRIKATAASMNAFVLLAHFTVGALASTEVTFKYSLDGISKLWIKLLKQCYEFWNLDIFRSVIPPFCVSETITNTHALALQYISAFYPLFLIAITYTCIHLHDNNFRPIVWLWTPFHKCLARCRRQCNPKASIIDAFATFLLLSYSKVMFVSAQFLVSTAVHSYNVTNPSVTTATYYLWDPTIRLFHDRHYLFAIIAIIFFSTFIALPPLLLVLYPTKAFQKCLGLGKCQWYTLRTFVDNFQGCYKDGTEGTRDCRYFAGLYFILRIAVFLSHTLLMPSYLLSWMVPGVIITAAALCLTAFRPYKEDKYNIIDSIFLTLFATNAFFIGYIPFAENQTTIRALYALIFTITSIPLLYLGIYVTYTVLTRSKVLQNCSFRATHSQINENDTIADRILNPEIYGEAQEPDTCTNLVQSRSIHPANTSSNVPEELFTYGAMSRTH